MGVNEILAFLTLISHIVAFVVILLFLFVPQARRDIISFFFRRAYLFAFIVALTSTLGSLFYSDILHYSPCTLCWYQRIFMYSQVPLLGLALFKRERVITDYILLLSFIGAVIAGYHYLLQAGYLPSIACSAVGYSVSCSQRFVMQYGYITIPLMALSAFLLNIVFMSAVKIEDRKKTRG